MILIKIAVSIVLILFIIVVPASIVNKAAKVVLEWNMSWIEAFRLVFGEMSAADIFWSCIAILFFTGCLILLWS
jgi:hypothetical protein